MAANVLLSIIIYYSFHFFFRPSKIWWFETSFDCQATELAKTFLTVKPEQGLKNNSRWN